MVTEFLNENIEYLNKQVQLGNSYLTLSEKIINGEYKLQKNLDTITFNSDPDWDYQHLISSNTYQLYLHTLNFNNDLVKSYIATKEVKYIVKSKNILESWIKNNINSELKRQYAWYDHTVANRIQNLLFYQVNAPKKYKIKKKKFDQVFSLHLEFLKRNENYPENNHGIMMDKALVISSLFLKDENHKLENILLAKSRVEKCILRDYSYKNVHLENSPDYHRMVTNWIAKLIKIFDDIRMPVSEKYRIKIKNATRYNGIICNYNNEYPMIGDTEFSKSNIKKIHMDFVDYEAGIGIFNDKRTESTMTFNCGYQSTTHKHHDDLSITLSLYNEAILVDSGKYNYNKNENIRKHIISPKAHSTLFVKDNGYDIGMENKIEIVSSFITKNYKVIKGIHKGYKGIHIERYIIVVDTDVYIILDIIKSKKENTYIQNFIFDDKVSLNTIGKRKYIMKTALNNEYILQEHSDKATAVIFQGEKHNAILSKKFNQITETNRLEIRKKQLNSTFISTISPFSKVIDEVILDDNNLSMNVNGKKISFNLF